MGAIEDNKPETAHRNTLQPNLTISADQWIRKEQARLLGKMLSWLTAAAGLGTIVVWAGYGNQSDHWQYWFLSGLMTFCCGLFILAIWWNRHGRDRASRHITIITLTIIFLAVSIAYEDLIVMGAILGLFITLLTTLLISPRAGFQYAVGLITVGILFITLLEAKLLAPPQIDQTIIYITVLAVYLTTLLLGTFLVAQNQSNIRKALAQLFDQSHTLNAINDERQHEIIERRAAEKELARQTQDLARSHAFISALSQVATRISATPDLDQVFQTLGSELKTLNISCLLGLLEGEERDIVAYYASWDAAVISLIERLIGFSYISARIPRQIWQKFPLVSLGQPMYVTDPISLTAELMPHIPFAIIKSCIRAVGITANTDVCYLPLTMENQVIGVIAVWGGDLHEADIPALMVFAGQVATAVQNVRLYEQVQHHSHNLELQVAQRTSELQEANEKLRELDQLKSKFIDDVSHELRTPVANLRLYLDLLERGQEDKRGRYLSVLNMQTERLIQLVEGIFQLSTLELMKGDIVFTAVSLNEIVEEVLASQRQRANSLGLRLSFTPMAGLLTIRGDAQQLAQVITHLVANAINYTSQGEILVSLGLASANSREVCLEVADTGQGIDPDDQKHLFERFYRGKSSGQSNIPGIGLGLAIVKEIVHLHEGLIEVESNLGQGTIFRVYFPRNRDQV